MRSSKKARRRVDPGRPLVPPGLSRRLRLIENDVVSVAPDGEVATDRRTRPVRDARDNPRSQ